jgi:hypothetical protein
VLAGAGDRGGGVGGELRNIGHARMMPDFTPAPHLSDHPGGS